MHMPHSNSITQTVDITVSKETPTDYSVLKEGV